MKDWNLVLIVADALRRDYLSCYGYQKAGTPNIDRLAQNGCMFSNAVSISCVTPVLFSSLFTGTYPFQHGIREFSFVLTDAFPTLAAIFGDAGFKTAAILGSVVLDKSRRFHAGFHDYNDAFDCQSLYNDRRLIEDPNNAIIFRLGEVNTDLAANWLRANGKEKFFLFLHYWDAHVPFFPPRRFLRREIADYDGIIDGSVKQIEQINAGALKVSERDVECLRGLYEGGVLNIDDGVGKIMGVLSELGALNRTVVIFIADHGCNLGEHDFFGNGRLLYDNDLRIPAIISGPMAEGVPVKRVDGLISTIDLFPTIMNGWGFDVPEHVRGIDAGPLMRGETTEIREMTYSETCFPALHENKRIALRGKTHKLIREPMELRKAGFLRRNLARLEVLLYRYRKNKTQRQALLKKVWDTLFVREKAQMDSRVEEAVMRRRGEVRELFDLVNDPEESRNLYDIRRDIAAEYETMLAEFIDGNAVGKAAGLRIEDDEIAERLKSLGYL